MLPRLPSRPVALLLALVLALPGLCAAGPDEAPYLFSYHDDGTARLVVANSQDGITFTNLPTFYTPPAGDGVRDASILRYRGTWYVVYTAGGFGAVPYFGVAKSTDFQTWNWVCNAATQPVGSPYTWAPEFFLDADGKPYVFVHVGRGDGGFNVVAFQPTRPDLSAWDSGTLVTDLSGHSLGYIDAQITGPIAGYYYMIARPYGEPGAANPLNILRSTSLLTGWSIYKNGDFGHWQTAHNIAEGCNLLSYSAGHWRIYALPEAGYGTYSYCYSESFDDMATWTPWTPVAGTTNAVHGTVLKYASPIFTNDVPPSAAVGTLYRFIFSADGRPLPVLSLPSETTPPPGLSFDPATGILSGTPTMPGVYPGFTLAAANTVSPDARHTWALTVNNTFANFAAAAGLAAANADPAADPDGDGLPNLLEYGLNLNPAAPDHGPTTPLDTHIRTDAGKRYLSIRFTRVPLAADLIYAVEASGNLQDWTAVATSTGGGAFVGPGVISDDAADTTPHTVEIRDPVPLDGTTPSRRFLRLRITR